MASNQDCRDLIVSLQDIPDLRDLEQRLEQRGMFVRRAMAPEKYLVIDWVRRHFRSAWASECELAFSTHPLRCLIATMDARLVGFCVYDSIALGVCGPIGIDAQLRSAGLGTALFVHTLLAMRSQGYAYAVIGWVAPGPAAFVNKVLPAQVIEHSAPHDRLYKGMLSD